MTSLAEFLVSIATPWHLWPWLAEAPRLEVTYHSLHYQDSLRSIMGDPEWVTSIHGRHPEQAPVRGETITRTVLEYASGAQALVVHRVQDAALDRLQSVAHVRQGALDDDAHRVVEIRAAHLAVDADDLDRAELRHAA